MNQVLTLTPPPAEVPAEPQPENGPSDVELESRGQMTLLA